MTESVYFKDRFTYHEPTPEQKIKFEIVRNGILQCANLIASTCPENSYFTATAIDELEKALNLAYKSISNPPPGKPKRKYKSDDIATRVNKFREKTETESLPFDE